MRMWSRYTLPLTVFLLALAGSVACTQPGASHALSPTAPSFVTPSASSAVPGVFAPTSVAGGSYNATGVWHLVITDQRSGEVYDDVDTELTQHPDGTITFCGECEGELFTLTPRSAGQGAAVPYELSYFGAGSPCNASLSGAAVLDARNDTITARGVRGINDDCSRLLVAIALARTIG
jgi:hypothetical protein